VLRRQDPEEFAGFVAGRHARMVRVAELLCGDRDRAEDLAQDGFARAYAAWGRIRSGDPEAYVRRCIVNANTDWWRRRTWREESWPDVPEQHGGPPWPGPGDLAELIATREVVLRALSRLTVRERVVLVLRYYLDLSEQQIGAELGIAAGTVKSTAARAVAKLRADTELRAEATP
jgi:RNA polymerase sigma-70 factor (sigma-E family)